MGLLTVSVKQLLPELRLFHTNQCMLLQQREQGIATESQREILKWPQTVAACCVMSLLKRKGAPALEARTLRAGL